MRTSTAPRSAMSSAIWTLVLILLIAPRYLPAMEDNEQPLYLEADSAEISEAKAVSIYTGNVLVRQDDMQLRGDRACLDPGLRSMIDDTVATEGILALRQHDLIDEGDFVLGPIVFHVPGLGLDVLCLSFHPLSIGRRGTGDADDRGVVLRIVMYRDPIAAGKERVKIRISPARR